MHVSDWLTFQICTIPLAMSYVLCFIMTRATPNLIFLSLVHATDAVFISRSLKLVFVVLVSVFYFMLGITRFFRCLTGSTATV